MRYFSMAIKYNYYQYESKTGDKNIIELTAVVQSKNVSNTFNVYRSCNSIVYNLLKYVYKYFLLSYIECTNFACVFTKGFET